MPSSSFMMVCSDGGCLALQLYLGDYNFVSEILNSN